MKSNVARQKNYRIGKINIDYGAKIFFACCSVAVVNSLSAKSETISFFVAILETVTLIYFLVWRSLGEFTIASLVLLSLSIESIGFALGSKTAISYSIYNVPIAKAYLLLIIMLLAIFKVFYKNRFAIDKIQFSNKMTKFYLINFICIISGFCMTIITVLFNDNNMLIHRKLWSYVARDMYEIIHIFSVLSLTVYCLKRDEDFKNKIEKSLLGILSGITWAAIILILCGNYYTSWGTEKYITCPLILFFAPGLILFSFKEKGLFNCLTGCIALLIQLKFTVGIAGTWWGTVFIILLFFFRSLLTIKDIRSKVLFKTIMIFCLVGIISVIYSEFHLKMEGQISYKLSSFMRLFSFKSSFYGWYEMLGSSIQARIEELVNVMIELIKNPWALLCGKGYGGTVLKYWGISDWNLSGSTFPDMQIAYKTYSSFHISIAEIIINFGLMGMSMIFFIIKNCVCEIFKKNGNMWIVLGGIWFVFFYSLYYSFNVGLVWLCYGFYIEDQKNQKYLCNIEVE